MSPAATAAAAAIRQKPSAWKNWLRPEVYPLFVFVGGAVSLAAFMLGRNLTSHPDVWVDKEERLAGIHQNYEEGRRYREHALRHFVSKKKVEQQG